jgi:predicted amidohydrolase
MGDILHVGFFHLGSQDLEEPLNAIEQSLSTYSDKNMLNASLVVLPEAFNIRGSYRNDSAAIISDFHRELQRLSTNFQLAMVVGLIEPLDEEGQNFSTANLIRPGDSRFILSRKMLCDSQGPYVTCQKDCYHPVAYRGLSVSALICLDALVDNDSDVNDLSPKFVH